MIWDGLLSVLTGGATGLIGTIAGKALGIWEESAKRKTKSLDHAHEVSLHRLNMESRGKELESEERIAEYNATSIMRTASYQHDTGYGKASQYVVNFLRLVRPGLTLILLGLTCYIVATVADVGLRAEVVMQVIFMTSMSLSWWWGDRSPKMQGQK
jgi:hypothetical protein